MQGTIVHCHTDKAYEVEFTNERGETLELLYRCAYIYKPIPLKPFILSGYWQYVIIRY
ncbi:MAG: DUF4926 domain-containing protein [Bacteroidetes bacterium]|nr:DUF4926 domain-containing protein [Bacteroidota bacterium]